MKKYNQPLQNKTPNNQLDQSYQAVLDNPLVFDDQNSAEYREFNKYRNKAAKYLKDEKKMNELIEKVDEKTGKKGNIIGNAKEQLAMLIELLKSYKSGEYRHIPVGSILMIIATFLYFINPFDIIPDFILGLGYLDDASVLGFTIRQISKDIEKYKLWREEKEVFLESK